MHQTWARANALLTNILLIASVLAAITSLTDFISVPPLPDLKIDIKSLEYLKRSHAGHDQALFTISSIKADLRPFWSWNTKQMFVYLQGEYVTAKNGLNQISFYDDILLYKKKANLQGNVRQEYQFIDQGNHLRGRPLNMTLVWSIMPRVGAMRQFSQTVDVGRLPSMYSEQPRAWGSWDIDGNV